MIRPRSGFTILELMIVMGILGLLSYITITTFSLFNTTQALNRDVQLIVTSLEEARSKTISSDDSSQYGIHFATTTITLFKGSSFNSADPLNQIVFLNTTNRVSAITLAGGVKDVIFSRISGDVSGSGTVVISSARASSTKTVTIYATGIVESN
ncbi:prepilin-type N-terminal cleavage/methylation domain-containing protein [Candidatus Parcubacteria bacterium]|nr:prepilin-type N-terminal cleavage/methylation domain-containing protein [Candidatus Parcubacteria bacterium]